jgi:hypothetical protein
MSYQFNLRIIKFVHEDILILHERFGYEPFTKAQAIDIPLRYSLKKLLNEAVISEHSKTNGRINYKLSKYVVDNCRKFEEKYRSKNESI